MPEQSDFQGFAPRNLGYYVFHAEWEHVMGCCVWGIIASEGTRYGRGRIV